MLGILFILGGVFMIAAGLTMKEPKARIRKLKDGVLWIIADEKVTQVIITGGTWHKVFEEHRDDKERPDA